MTLETTGRQFSEIELEELTADLNRDGLCILRGVFAPSLVERWAQAFQALFAERQARPGGLAPREQARYYLTLPWTAPFADEAVFANPAILGVLNRVFPQEYAMVQLGADVPLKGSDYQEIHRDYRPLFTDATVTPLYALAVNFPLVDVTSENGPFEQARGTHLLPREEALQKVASGEIPMETFPLQRGDVMIRTPLALHRGTPNRTDAPRPMVVMGYVMHWLHTPKVDLTLPRDYYDRLPPNLQKMLRCEVVEALPHEKNETYVNFKY
jgi:ectoine hydroxylase-related dioxygenase (phytanoyl-CoA dioxygenase family)